MDQSWLISTIDYMYKTVSGENDEGKSNSDYQRAFSNGIWVNDLPSNNYEPLESCCLDKRQSSPQEVCVTISSSCICYDIAGY